MHDTLAFIVKNVQMEVTDIRDEIYTPESMMRKIIERVGANPRLAGCQADADLLYSRLSELQALIAKVDGESTEAMARTVVAARWKQHEITDAHTQYMFIVQALLRR